MTVRKRVVCVGNELCHDDGVAAAIGRALEPYVDSADLEIVFAAEFGLSTLDAFLDVEQVVVVDAITTGGAPGACSLHEDLDFVPSATCSIGHAITLSSLIELVARLRDDAVPPRVSVVAVEAENLAPFGIRLSPQVQQAIPHAVKLVLQALSAQRSAQAPPAHSIGKS